MAKPGTTDRAEDAADLGGAAGGVPDIADDLADMLRRGRVAGPTAAVSVEWKLADGRRVYMELPAPTLAGRQCEPADENEQTQADKVLAYLSQLRPGEWAKGRTIAAEIDLEYDGGQFKKLLAGMVQDDLLESSKTAGYRLRRHNGNH